MIKALGTGGLAALLLCSLLFAACKREDERDLCFEPKTVYLSMGAYRTADTGTAILDTVLPNPIMGPVDSPRFFDYAAASKFIVYLSPLQDTCRYYIQPDSAVSLMDTLTFRYTRRLQFLSNACGYAYFFNLQQVLFTKHMIDSVRINNFDVTNNASIEHLRVYFRH